MCGRARMGVFAQARYLVIHPPVNLYLKITHCYIHPIASQWQCDAVFSSTHYFKGIKMPAINSTSIDFASFSGLSDLGYKQAYIGDTLKIQAQYALNNIVGFPDEIGKTDKASLFAGYQLRYAEINPKVEYAIVNNQYLKVDDLNEKEKEKIEKLERVFIDVNYAMSFSQQSFGALRNDPDPAKVNLHAIVKNIRDKFATYSSNKLNKLKATARELQNEGVKRERGANKSFNDRVDATLADLKDKCKTANARGDVTADTKALTDAIAAFLKVWVH